MAGQGGGVGHDDTVADLAVVGDMAIGHEQVVVADAGHAAALLGSAVHGDEFPDDVAVADLEPCGLAPVAEVLRCIAQTGMAVNGVAAADAGRSENGGVRADGGRFADLDIGADAGKGADAHARSQLGQGVDHGGRMDVAVRAGTHREVSVPLFPGSCCCRGRLRLCPADGPTLIPECRSSCDDGLRGASQISPALLALLDDVSSVSLLDAWGMERCACCLEWHCWDCWRPRRRKARSPTPTRARRRRVRRWVRCISSCTTLAPSRTAC